MMNLYQKIKQWIIKEDTLHIFLSFMLSIMIADLFKMMGTADKWVMIIVCPVIAFFVGLFGEYLDSWTTGNEFSPRDLLRAVIGCVVGMVAIAIMIL